MRGSYGVFSDNDRLIPAHRWAYEREHGPIPEGFEIDHVCRNRACVRPSHLRAVDHRTNVLAGVGHSAVNARKTQCPKGHEYTVRQRKDRSCGFQRVCVICRDERYAKRAKRVGLATLATFGRRTATNGDDSAA